jgi:hypothetical protein
MNKTDALEAAPIVVRCCQNLLRTINAQGRLGIDARTQIGDTIAHAYEWLRANTLGPELDQCFNLINLAGATYPQLDHVRNLVSQETPITLGGLLVQNSIIRFCLAYECVIIVNMTFVSRQDVDIVKEEIQQPFLDAEEQAADDMIQMEFQILVRLRGSIVNHLVTTQRPLPQMLTFQFIGPSTTLVMAYKLYSDAGRADQVRDENKIVHPAFAPAIGQALSA